MADAVSILGTVVGVASLAIQVSDNLRQYWKKSLGFQSQVERMLEDTQRLSEVLKNLRNFLEQDPTRLSKSFTSTSTLYSASVRCEIRLLALVEALRRELEGSKSRKLLRALKWPFKVEETEAISTELRGYMQTFQFALTIDGCTLLLQSSEEVTNQLRNLNLSAASTQQRSEETLVLLKAIESLPQTAFAIQRGVDQLEARAQDVGKREILDWLGSNTASAKHDEVRKVRLPETGNWIFECDEYVRWKMGDLPVLWCQGKPGAGKSTLLSRVADTLVSDADRTQAVAFFYCEFTQSADQQSAPTIASCLMHQLLLQLDDMPKAIAKTFRDHMRRITRPNVEESVALLLELLTGFRQVFLLIDALDELEPDSRDNLMEVIDAIIAHVKIFLTSRPQAIDKVEIEEKTIQYSFGAQDEDLVTFVRARTSKAAIASRRVRQSSGWNDFVEQTVAKLVDLADGMFILVSMQLEMLLKQRTIAEMKKCLANISTRLDDFYRLSIQRILEPLHAEFIFREEFGNTGSEPNLRIPTLHPHIQPIAISKYNPLSFLKVTVETIAEEADIKLG